MSEIVTKAREWAHLGHDSIGQKRKYNDMVYWTHTDAVSDMLRDAGEREEVQAAGDMHDLLEDVAPKNPEFSESKMREKFGNEITDLVIEVTNVFTKENYPNLNRARRKRSEHERLAKISKDAKSIKLADIIHNCEGLVSQNSDFAKVFLAEKILILPHFKEGNSTLYKRAVRVVADEIAKLRK